jgi:hypothetical protein
MLGFCRVPAWAREKDAKIVEICKKISRKCRVFLSSGDFPSLMQVGSPGPGQQAGPPTKVAAHITCCMHTLYEIAHHHKQVSVLQEPSTDRCPLSFWRGRRVDIYYRPMWTFKMSSCSREAFYHGGIFLCRKKMRRIATYNENDTSGFKTSSSHSAIHPWLSDKKGFLFLT